MCFFIFLPIFSFLLQHFLFPFKSLVMLVYSLVSCGWAVFSTSAPFEHICLGLVYKWSTNCFKWQSSRWPLEAVTIKILPHLKRLKHSWNNVILIRKISKAFPVFILINWLMIDLKTVGHEIYSASEEGHKKFKSPELDNDEGLCVLFCFSFF